MSEAASSSSHRLPLVLYDPNTVLERVSGTVRDFEGDSLDLQLRVGAISLRLLGEILTKFEQAGKNIGSMYVHVFAYDDEESTLPIEVAGQLLRVVSDSIYIKETRAMELDVEDIREQASGDIRQQIERQSNSQREIDESLHQKLKPSVEKTAEWGFRHVLSWQREQASTKELRIDQRKVQDQQLRITQRGTPAEVSMSGLYWSDDGASHIIIKGAGSEQLFRDIPFRNLDKVYQITVRDSDATDEFFTDIAARLTSSVTTIGVKSLPNVTIEGIKALWNERLTYLCVRNCPRISMQDLLDLLSHGEAQDGLFGLKLDCQNLEEFRAFHLFMQNAKFKRLNAVSINFHFDPEGLEDEIEELKKLQQKPRFQWRFNTVLNKGETKC